MIRRLAGLVLVCMLLSLEAPAQTASLQDVFNAIVTTHRGGHGVVVCGTGVIALPTGTLPQGPEISVDVEGQSLKAKTLYQDIGSGFALLQLPKGNYHTAELGDLSLLQTGDKLTTMAGEASALEFSTDLKRNEQYVVLDTIYSDELQGTPVFDSESKIVAIITGPAPGGCRALSCRSIKLAFFEAKLPPLKANLHPSLPGGSEVNAAEVQANGALNPARVEEWEFPFGNEGTTRTRELLSLDEWRFNTGTQGARLAPLAFDDIGRMYLATLRGSIYCLDFENRQMVWRSALDPGGIVLWTPMVFGNHLVIANGGIGLWVLAKGRTGDLTYDLMQDIAGRVQHTLTLNFGRLYALGDSGVESWMVPTRFPSQPLRDGKHILFSGLGAYGRLDTENGRVQWIDHAPPKRSQAIWYSLQAVKNGIVYGLSVPVRVHGGIESNERLHLEGDGSVTAFAIRTSTGATIWSQRVPDSHLSLRPLGVRLDLSDKALYVSLPERRVVLDILTGKPGASYEREDSALLDRLALSDETFYGVDSLGLYALDAANGRTLWRHSLSGATSAPMARGDRIYVASHHQIDAVDKRSGRRVWFHKVANRISGQPVVHDGWLYYVSLEGVIGRVRL